MEILSQMHQGLYALYLSLFYMDFDPNQIEKYEINLKHHDLKVLYEFAFFFKF